MSYYDRTGERITDREYVALMSADCRTVALDTFDDITVSTVWLGIDHQYGAGPPLIFETMIFGGPLDEEQWRYSTENSAIAGHAAAVALAKAAVR